MDFLHYGTPGMPDSYLDLQKLSPTAEFLAAINAKKHIVRILRSDTTVKNYTAP